jgi:hypothetical protein
MMIPQRAAHSSETGEASGGSESTAARLFLERFVMVLEMFLSSFFFVYGWRVFE